MSSEYLCDADYDGNIQCEGNGKMFFGHSNQSRIAPHHEYYARRCARRESVQSCLKVLLVPGKVCMRTSKTIFRLKLGRDKPIKETIFAACTEISSQPSFSRRMTSLSFEAAAAGTMDSPDGANRGSSAASVNEHVAEQNADLHYNARRPPSFDFVFMSE